MFCYCDKRFALTLIKHRQSSIADVMNHARFPSEPITGELNLTRVTPLETFVVALASQLSYAVDKVKVGAVATSIYIANLTTTN